MRLLFSTTTKPGPFYSPFDKGCLAPSGVEYALLVGVCEWVAKFSPLMKSDKATLFCVLCGFFCYGFQFRARIFVSVKCKNLPFFGGGAIKWVTLFCYGFEVNFQYECNWKLTMRLFVITEVLFTGWLSGEVWFSFCVVIIFDWKCSSIYPINRWVVSGTLFQIFLKRVDHNWLKWLW